jgi:hypothetical protein
MVNFKIRRMRATMEKKKNMENANKHPDFNRLPLNSGLSLETEIQARSRPHQFFEF